MWKRIHPLHDDFKHSANLCKKYLKNKVSPHLSLDLNAIEHLWGHLKREKNETCNEEQDEAMGSFLSMLGYIQASTLQCQYIVMLYTWQCQEKVLSSECVSTW